MMKTTRRLVAIASCDFNLMWNHLRIVKRGLGELRYTAVQTNDTRKFSISLR